LTYFNDQNIEKLAKGYSEIEEKFNELFLAFLNYDCEHNEVVEYITHGFLRRLKTLKYCIEKIYDQLPPEQSDIPRKTQTLEATVALQSFYMNLYGSIDNLAWVLAIELQLKNKKGEPLSARRSKIGLKPSHDDLKSQLSIDFCNAIGAFDDWFEQVEDYRDALAHRIPLFIPPYRVREEDVELHNQLEQERGRCIISGDYKRLEQIEGEQEALGVFQPVMAHSINGNAREIVFHPQVLSDFNTVCAIANLTLSELQTAKKLVRLKDEA
jgi:hypothetical protein